MSDKEKEGNVEDDVIEADRTVKLSKPSRDLGITSQYTGNRQKLWDDTKAKQAYKNAVFGDRQTIMDEDGNLLHRDQKAAQEKYHMKDSDGHNISKKWAAHYAETDHKISLESLHEHAKYNPFLSDEDLKEIANSSDNYQILSKSKNASKGAENTATLKDHAIMQGKFAQRTAQNMAYEFTDGAVESVKVSAISIMHDSLEKLLIEGESVEDTLKYGGKAAVNAAVVGGTEKLLIDTATQIFKNSGNEVLKCIVDMNAVGQCLVLGAAIGNSAIKYLNGEISAEEFADEIVQHGTAIGIATITSVAVPIIGPFISYIAVKAVSLIHETKKHMNNYLLKEEAIRSLEHKAIAEMECQRNNFRSIVQKNLDEWDATVEDAFYQMIIASFEDSFSLDRIVEGLDGILSLCGEKAKFHSLNEWEKQLDTPLELSF